MCNSHTHEYVEAARLANAIRGLMTSRGLPEDAAAELADALVETSLLGIDTHGVRLLPTYLREIDEGRANSRPLFQITGDFCAAAVLHADRALGVVAANAAMREAVRRASLCGVAAVAVSDSNHFGAAGHYARFAARQGCIGLVFSNSDALVAPDGGTIPLNGTNPIAMAAPGLDDDGFFLDMATSQISYSRMMQRFDRDTEAIPPLPPLGGYKGQGLGTMVQILCAVLAGEPFDADLSHLYAPPYDTPRRISHLMVAIAIRAFCEPRLFRARVSQLMQRFRESAADSERAVIVAGDREAQHRRERLSNGIPVGDAELALLQPWLSTNGGTPGQKFPELSN